MKVVAQYTGKPQDVARKVREAEAMGYDAVTTGETNHDSIVAMSLAVAASERVEVCSSVTIAFPRSPMVLAQEAWDLQAASNGRINIGLGSQVKGHNLRRYAGTWSPPVPRMRDYIKGMRAVWDCWQNGTKLNYVSENYTMTLMTYFFNPGPLTVPPPKVSLSAVNPLMAALAGEVADGFLPHGFTTEKYMKDVLIPAVQRGAQRAGRSMNDIEISFGGMLVVGENESEIEQKLQYLREPISFYGSTRSYHGVFRAHNREDLGMMLHEMSLKARWDEMKQAIPEEVLREFAITATYETLPQAIREHAGYASRMGRLPMPMETEAQRERARWVLSEVQRIPPPVWQ